MSVTPKPVRKAKKSTESMKRSLGKEMHENKSIRKIEKKMAKNLQKSAYSRAK
jgi:hypothetical protein